MKVIYWGLSVSQGSELWCGCPDWAFGDLDLLGSPLPPPAPLTHTLPPPLCRSPCACCCGCRWSRLFSISVHVHDNNTCKKIPDYSKFQTFHVICTSVTVKQLWAIKPLFSGSVQQRWYILDTSCKPKFAFFPLMRPLFHSDWCKASLTGPAWWCAGYH